MEENPHGTLELSISELSCDCLGLRLLEGEPWAPPLNTCLHKCTFMYTKDMPVSLCKAGTCIYNCPVYMCSKCQFWQAYQECTHFGRHTSTLLFPIPDTFHEEIILHVLTCINTTAQELGWITKALLSDHTLILMATSV